MVCLLQFLSGSNAAASGVAGVNTGLGNQLAANYGTQAGMNDLGTRDLIMVLSISV